MVRNEADVIEWWARYNLRVLDRLDVIDHQSLDNTVEILQRLRAEGLPIVVHSFASSAHLQADAMHQLALPLAAAGDADFLVPLDADELLATDRATLHRCLQSLPEGHVGAMAWRTYLPEPQGADDAFFRVFSTFRSEEDAALSKVIVPVAMYGEMTRWCTGNHSLYNRETGEPFPAVSLSVVLAHYPVRDLQQLQRKVVLGSLASRLKSQRFKGESWHWLQLDYQLRRHQRLGSLPDLKQIAMLYSFEFMPDLSVQRVLSGSIEPAPELSCRYTAQPLSLEQVEREADRLRQAHGEHLATVGFAEFNAANQAFRDGDPWEAYLRYSEAVFLNPGLLVAHLGRARSLVSANSLALALDAFEDLFQLEPSHYDGLLEYGHVLRRLGRGTAAHSAYCQAIDAAPDRFEAHLALGRLLQEQGDLPAGEMAYRRARQAAAAADSATPESPTRLPFVEQVIAAYQAELSAGRGS